MKIAVLSRNKPMMEQIRQILLEGAPPTRQIKLFDEDAGAFAGVVQDMHPDLVILDEACCGNERLELLERLTAGFSDIAFILVCSSITSDFLINAMRLGVKDVLHLPLESPALRQAVMRIEKGIKKPVEKARAKVLAFLPCKGGSGATFLATNLGYALATREPSRKVVLLDLNLQFGDAALFISDQVPPNSMADVAANIARLDATLLASSLIPVLPNYGLLAAPEDPERAVDVRPEHVDALMELVMANYDYVLLDIGRIFNAVSLRALDHADMIFPVLQATLPFIRDSKRLLRTLQSLGFPKDKVRLIVNRHEKGGEIRLEDIESTLGMKVFKVIPNSYEIVSTSVNQGVPLLKLSGHDPVSHALHEIVNGLVEVPHERARKSGWLSQILQRA